MEKQSKQYDNGNILVLGLAFIIIGVILTLVGLRVYDASQNNSKINNKELENQSTPMTDKSNQQERTKSDSFNDGTLEIADTSLVVTYPTGWSATNSDALYDYVLSSDTSFKLSIDVINPGEGGKGCGDCIYEALNQKITIEGNDYYLAVAGEYSTYNGKASNVTLTTSPDKLVLPTLNSGKQLFYQLVYFPGSPSTLSLDDDSFKAAVNVMTSISEK